MEPGELIGDQLTRRMKIVGVHKDHVLCEQPNVIGEDIEVKVAKPYNLRATTFDGMTLSYVNWSNGTTVNIAYTAHASSSYNSRTADYQSKSATCDKGPHIELLYPPYQVGDYITISVNTVGNEGDEVQGMDTNIVTLDENREGRHWKDDCGAAGGGGSVWV